MVLRPGPADLAVSRQNDGTQAPELPAAGRHFQRIFVLKIMKVYLNLKQIVYFVVYIHTFFIYFMSFILYPSLQFERGRLELGDFRKENKIFIEC